MERFLLELRILPRDVPWPNRVRSALKLLLRSYGLKNEYLRPLDPGERVVVLKDAIQTQVPPTKKRKAG